MHPFSLAILNWKDESQRVAGEVGSRQTTCFGDWTSQTGLLFNEQTSNTSLNYRRKMDNFLNRFDFGFNKTSEIFSFGDTACNFRNSTVISRKEGIEELINGTTQSLYYLEAFESPLVWKEVKEYADEICYNVSECEGWTWVAPTGRENGSLVFLNEIIYPITSYYPGICHLVIRWVFSFLSSLCFSFLRKKTKLKN